MRSQLLSAALLATSLFTGAFAARSRSLNANTRRRAEGMVQRAPVPEPAQLEERATSRFLTNSSKKYVVESMPSFDFNIGEMYSGVMPIDMKNTSRGLFFVFQPRVGGPAVDEITIWLNGGPGCSSLEGFLQETGKFQWSWGQYSPTINEYSWVNLTNVLWVEYPVGVGFSIGDSRATSEEVIAAEFSEFFLNFQKAFGISKFKIFVTGESYAGRYVPYIAADMLDRNDTTHYNLSGILVYDPCIGDYGYTQQAFTLPWLQKNNNVMGFNSTYMADVAALDQSCGYSQFREKWLQFPAAGVQPALFFNSTSQADCDVWDMSYFAAYTTNPCFNPYEPNLQCPLLSDPLGFPTDLEYSYPGLPIYFNRTDVKKAFHAPMDVDWAECVGNPFIGNPGPQDIGDESLDPIQYVLPKVIEATQRVLVANGDLDFEILTNGTLSSIQNMTWGGKLGFQTRPSTPIYITLPDLQYDSVFTASGFPDVSDPQGTMGVQHYERGLMFAETYLCGHMEPQFQPRVAYRHLQWVLGRIETL